MSIRFGMRKLLLGLHAALVAFAFSASAFATAPITIEIQKFAFSQKEITIPAGTSLTWINRDETPHTVTASDKSFTSKALDTDDRYEHTFDREGDYSYFCVVHPFMTGIVHVRKQ